MRTHVRCLKIEPEIQVVPWRHDNVAIAATAIFESFRIFMKLG